jgi:hypothetical protein
MSTQLQHKGLADGKWRELPLVEQLANVGSEVIRSIKWRDRNEEFAQKAAERALELLSFTKSDPKNRTRLRELTRLYEVVVNDLYGFDDFTPDLQKLEAYFNAFTYAASLNRRVA